MLMHILFHKIKPGNHIILHNPDNVLSRIEVSYRMSRYYRYRLPPWARKWIIIIERCTLPLLIFQLIRTLLFPTTLDVIILAIFVLLFVAFYQEWI